MVSFRNIVTGNVLHVTDKGTIALMERSSRYEKVTKKSFEKQTEKVVAEKA